jgi:histidyl-tRNA synthetase
VANVKNAIAPALPALKPAFDDLAVVTGVLEASGVAPVVQAVLARSFEYYSGTVFKIFAGDTRVCSGGRYDHLIGLIGDRPAAASGFAHYVSPIVERMRISEPPESARRVLVEAPDTVAGIAAAHAAASALRAAGMIAATSAAGSDNAGAILRVGSNGESFALTDGEGTRQFSSLDEVVTAFRGNR